MDRERGALYAVYKGSRFLGIGTASELAEKLGVSPAYVRWMSTPSARRRDKGNMTIAEKVM